MEAAILLLGSGKAHLWTITIEDNIHQVKVAECWLDFSAVAEQVKATEIGGLACNKLRYCLYTHTNTYFKEPFQAFTRCYLDTLTDFFEDNISLCIHQKKRKKKKRTHI